MRMESKRSLSVNKRDQGMLTNQRKQCPQSVLFIECII